MAEPPATVVESELAQYVEVVEALASIAVKQQDCAATGREMLAIIAGTREVIRSYHRPQTVEDDFAEMAAGDPAVHERLFAAKYVVEERWDVCAEDPGMDAMYRIVFLGE